ncbi:hypothetical protein EBR25_00125 [bacterium]|nr:hypothetical protein [bacterium]
MIMLVFACLALLAGPLLYQLVNRSPRALNAIDGFVFVSISGLLIIHLLAESDESFGFLTLGVLALGLFGPLFLERFFQRIEHEVHIATMILGAVGFLIHTSIDGAALALNHGEGIVSSSRTSLISLAPAIVIHRLPVGLTLWWLLKPRFGIPIAFLALTCAVVATFGGYVLAGSPVVQSLEYTFPWVEAFVAGSILHVVLFRFHLHGDEHHHMHEGHGAEAHGSGHNDAHALLGEPARGVEKWISNEGIGNLLGILLLTFIFFSMPASHGHHHSEVSFFSSFLALASDSAPALLFAYFAGIFIYGFFPESSVQWMRKGGRVRQAAKGMMVGLPLPICSCGVLPYYQALVKKGAPPAAAVAFLIATPELGLDAVFLSLPLLGKELMVIRLVASALIAFVVAAIVSRFITQRKTLPVLNEALPPSLNQRIKRGAHFALVELVDTTAPWMLLGLVLAAMAGPVVQEFGISQLHPILEVFLFSGIGMVVYVCASGATPLVAALLVAGVSPGAGLAFLLTGPATNISTFGILSELHGKKIAFLFAALMLLLALMAGVVTNLMLPEYSGIIDLGSEVHHVEQGLFPALRSIALALVALLFLASFARQGGRKFFGHVLGDQVGH